MQIVTASDVELQQLALRPGAITSIIEAAELWHRDLENLGGFQLVIFKEDQLVLSLWEGRDVFTSRPIRRDMLFPILSATKGLASMVLLHLHYLKYFDWQDRISHYWPRFGCKGKSGATIEHLLSHRLGIPYLTAEWTHWSDRKYMTALVKEAETIWRAGTRYGYHGGSWGVIVDELVRRWTGGNTGEVLRHGLAESAGVTNCYIGLPKNRWKDITRLAYLEPDQRQASEPLGPIGPDSGYNSLDILATCQSSGGAVSSAEDMARVYNLVARGGKARDKILWSPSAQVSATQPRNHPDREAPAARQELLFAWGLGFMVSPSRTVYGTVPPSGRTAGHPGASGAVGYADPDHGLSVAFTINGVGGRRMYARYRLLGDLVQSALLPVA
ncbi:MAG: serine hydrolase domain-containing protein [Pseudonocardiaceae bacterium]